MGDRVLKPEEAIQVAKHLRHEGKKIVLAGGCFDILHRGHIEFLKAVKQSGDIVFVFLENDERIHQIKGNGRPIHSQQDRAEILSELRSIDFVVMLPFFTTDDQYDDLTKKIKPAIIAATRADPYRFHKERQAKQISSEVVDVIDRITNQSTTETIKLLSEK